MKIRITPLAALAVAILSTGCVTPPGPSVASLGAGSDSAALNSSRGRSDAQISKDQATQYSRQREQVSEEMQLEQQKRRNTMENVNGVVNIFGSALRAR